MAASFVAQANTGSDVLVASQQVTKPGGVASGDVAVLTLVRWNSANSFPALTGPAGSVLRGQLAAGAGGSWQHSAVFLVRVGAESSYTVSWTGAQFSCLAAEFFTGVDAALDLATVPFDIVSALNTATVPTATVTTVSGAGLSWHVNTQGYSATPTHEPPTGFTEAAEAVPWAIAHRVSPGAGAQSASGATIVGETQPQLVASLVALTPAAAAGVTGSGSAAAKAALVSGSGSVRVSGSGSAAARAAQVAGSGSLDSVHVNGSGQAAPAAGRVAGAGSVTTAGSGAAAAPAGSVSGAGSVAVSGSGQAAAPPAQASGRESAPGPFVAGVSGLHFVDGAGQPILVRGDTVWAFPVNAGRWNGGDWAADLTAYFTARAAQGYNALYHAALGSTQNNGPANTGATFDGVLPFVGGEPGSLNETYWARVDFMLTRAEAVGITIFLNWAYSDDLANAALSGKTATQCNAYGAALGARYKNRPNLVWGIGGDYFGGDDTRVGQVLSGIRSTGDTHLIAVQYYPETTSRQDLQSGAVQPWGDANAQYDFVYSYNVGYYGTEQAYADTPNIPVLLGDGTYDDDSAADRRIMRQHTWWALTSGSRGSIYGGETIWGWGSGALAKVQTSLSGFSDADLPTIRDAFAGLPGWHLLLPDSDSSLVTAGRGTRAASLASGGGGGQYTGSPQDTWVSAGVAPDGSLAVVYCPVATTLTIDDTELAATYTATWLDPVTGAATPATVASSYTTPGTNSVGESDWVLALQATDTAAVTGSGQATASPARVAGAGAVTVSGSGQAQPAPARAAATATAPATGSGQARAASGLASGSGSAVVTGTGQVGAAAAVVSGAAASIVTATGQAAAPVAVAAGSGAVPVTGSGQVSAPPAVAHTVGSTAPPGVPVPLPTSVTSTDPVGTVSSVATAATVVVAAHGGTVDSTVVSATTLSVDAPGTVSTNA